MKVQQDNHDDDYDDPMETDDSDDDDGTCSSLLACKALALCLPWLSVHDLASIGSVNRSLRDSSRGDHLWSGILQRLESKVVLHDAIVAEHKVEMDDWITNSGDAPSEIPWTLFLPHRSHGAMHDNFSWFPHPRDRVARRHPSGPLVLSRGYYSKLANNGTVLMDRFRPQDAPSRHYQYDDESDAIYLPRSFPIECKACHNLVLNNPKEMVQHCATSFEHRNNSKPMERPPLPDEFVDPRWKPSYATTGTFEKAKSLCEYRDMVLSILRCPPTDEAGLANMIELLESTHYAVRDYYDRPNRSEQDIEDKRDTLALCTLDRVIEVCIDYAVRDFEYFGLSGHSVYAVDVIVNGWKGFELLYQDDYDELWYNVTGIVL